MPRNDYTWIGINDREREGNYVYQSNNQTVNFTHWQSIIQQPDNAGDNEHCVEIFYLSATGWNDRACTHLNRVLCETPGF